jgi:hypothetical protein
MSWQSLKSTYSKHGIFLALGAGVSVGSLLPTWVELLRRLSVEIMGSDTQFEALQSAGFTLPAVAGILKHSCPEPEDFARYVRKALYRDFPFFPAGVGKHNHTQLVHHVRDENPTLRSVASLCASRIENERVFVANPLIHAVVSFNLDALLQAYIYSRYRKRLLRTIERPSASRRPEKINIYHMHGFLRFDEKWSDPSKGASDKLTLTEHEYFDFFNAPTSLFNYTFLHLLREYSCLFIGLSMRDDNIRRLLHYSKQERLNALLEEGQAPDKAEEATQRHFAILMRSGSRDMDDLLASSLLTLGTRVLWINAYTEIPERLGEIYTSADSDWEAVF